MSGSERLQERNQRLLVVRRKIEAELVTLHRARFESVANVPGRHIVVVEPPRVEPVFQRRDRTVVLKGPAIPDAAERRNLVVAGATSRLEGQVRIRPDRAAPDVKPLDMSL